MITFDYVPAHFRFTLDGEERILPALEGELLGRWHARYASASIGGLEIVSDAIAERDLRAVVEASALGMDALLEALIAYDVSGVFGGRDWLESNLTERQLILILRRIQRAHA